MRKLEFIGTVQANKQALVIPGRNDLFLKPEDWPKKLAPGILNISISGFLEGFEDGLDRLDEGKFRAAMVIPQRKIAGSTLKPDADHPTRGFAQVWRADLQVVATGQTAKCWALRVIG